MEQGQLLKQLNTPKILKRIYRFFNRNMLLIYSREYQLWHQLSQGAPFDTEKFPRILEQLKTEGLYRIYTEPEMIPWEDMATVHARKYLEWVENPLNLQQIINSYHLSIFDTDAFDLFRYIAGGTLLAGELALKEQLPVFHLGGGFHHASKYKGAGFCPINDVAIAAATLYKQKKANQILIIDLDYHQGNGTRSIFRYQPDIFTFSLHASEWEDSFAKSNRDVLIPHTISNQDYLNKLKKELKKLKKQLKPDLIFYLSGSDPYEGDELCDMSLTEETMLQRDLIVWTFAQESHTPMAVLPAGGYGSESWKIYFNFIKWVILNG